LLILIEIITRVADELIALINIGLENPLGKDN